MRVAIQRMGPHPQDAGAGVGAQSAISRSRVRVPMRYVLTGASRLVYG